MNLKKSEIIALKNENLSCREIAVGLLTFYQTWKKMERGKVTGMSEQSKQNQAMCSKIQAIGGFMLDGLERLSGFSYSKTYGAWLNMECSYVRVLQLGQSSNYLGRALGRCGIF